VFFKREWNRNWPFLVGFAVTGTIITKMSLGLTGTLPSDLLQLLFFSFAVPKPLIPLICNHRRGRCEELSLRSEAQEVNSPITKP